MADDKMEVDQTKIKENESKNKEVTETDKTKEKSSKKESEPEKSVKSEKSEKSEKSDKEKKESSGSQDTKKKENDKTEDKTKDTDKKLEDNKSAKDKSETKDKSSIDREKVCPFLLRVFCKRGSHHRIEDFTINRQPVEDEIQIYTWKDASLRELASLLAEVDPKYAKHGTSISFKSVYLDNIRARYNSKDLGVVNLSKPAKTDDTTLDENKFIIGDFIDVAIQTYADLRRKYSYDRQDSFSSGNNINSRLGSSRELGRFSGGRGNLRSIGASYDRKRKDKIGERHDRFSSRTMRDEGRRGSYRIDRISRN